MAPEGVRAAVEGEPFGFRPVALDGMVGGFTVERYVDAAGHEYA